MPTHTEPICQLNSIFTFFFMPKTPGNSSELFVTVSFRLLWTASLPHTMTWHRKVASGKSAPKHTEVWMWWIGENICVWVNWWKWRQVMSGFVRRRQLCQIPLHIWAPPRTVEWFEISSSQTTHTLYAYLFGTKWNCTETIFARLPHSRVAFAHRVTYNEGELGVNCHSSC